MPKQGKPPVYVLNRFYYLSDEREFRIRGREPNYKKIAKEIGVSPTHLMHVLRNEKSIQKQAEMEEKMYDLGLLEAAFLKSEEEIDERLEEIRLEAQLKKEKENYLF